MSENLPCSTESKCEANPEATCQHGLQVHQGYGRYQRITQKGNINAA